MSGDTSPTHTSHGERSSTVAISLFNVGTGFDQRCNNFCNEREAIVA